MPEVKIDVGIGEALKVIDKIFARRHDRAQRNAANFYDDVKDDADAVYEIVTKLDQLFIDLVSGYEDPVVLRNPTELERHMRETAKYLGDRRLLPKLEEVTGRVEGIVSNPDMYRQRYPRLFNALASLFQNLGKYRDQLGEGAVTGKGLDKDVNLMTCYQRGQEFRDGKTPLADLQKTARLVKENQNYGVSSAILRDVGRIKSTAQPDPR
jgi:hypothetical protein